MSVHILGAIFVMIMYVATAFCGCFAFMCRSCEARMALYMYMAYVSGS